MTFSLGIKATYSKICIENDNHICLKNIFAIRQQKIKNLQRTVILVFGIEVDID